MRAEIMSIRYGVKNQIKLALHGCHLLCVGGDSEKGTVMARL
jgi:hypothetical protein